MQSEFFDKKIKEAADHHHPAYDEQAWKHMEKLLDKHLPQEDDNRRRFIFFILLFLLIGGGGTWLLIGQPWKKDQAVSAVTQPVAATEKTGTSSTVTPAGSKDQTIQLPVANRLDPELPAKRGGNEQATTVNQDPSPVITHSNTGILTPKYNRRDPLSRAINRVINKEEKKNTPPADLPREATTEQPADAVPVTIPETAEPMNKPVRGEDKTINVKEPVTSGMAKQAIEPSTEKIPTTGQKTTAKNKKGEKKVHSFFLSFSAGPDISFTGNDQWGKTRLLAGIGAGFTIKDRVMIRTGMYSGRKIYTAKPGAYHPPEAFWNYYPYLEKVEADCKVIEIPLTISYQFGRSSKEKWMASAGLSSYLMKEENYNYYYKYYPGSPTYSHLSSIRNENNHYFSVVTLSAGYKRKLGNRVTVMAEPYLKLPVKGVGYGKVKLNSGGVLFSIGVNPFAAKVKTPSPR